MAKKYGLAVFDKSDSQDICFVGKGGYKSVIEKIRPGAIDPGNIVDIEGNVLGRHNGIIGYTIGQRRGLGINNANEPLYVISIDAEQNKIVVGSEKDLYKNALEIKTLNWLGKNKYPEDGTEVTVKLRSLHDGCRAKVYRVCEDIWKISLTNGDKSITPGQACVMYDGDIVFGWRMDY